MWPLIAVVDRVDHGGERRAFAAAGGAGDEDQAARQMTVSLVTISGRKSSANGRT